MVLKSQWLSKEERINLEYDTQTDDKLVTVFGFTDYRIKEIRKNANHIRKISSTWITGMHVPTHESMRKIRNQARESRDYHFLIDQATGRINRMVYCPQGSWLSNKPPRTYEITLGMSDIPPNPSYRDLLESIVDQMISQGDKD
jgi:hypothetical protein